MSKYLPAGHVITGNLNVIPDARVRHICSKGPKHSGEILNKFKARDFNATSFSTYDVSTLYTTLPQNLIKVKLIDLIERTFQREGSPYLACNDKMHFYFGKP